MLSSGSKGQTIEGGVDNVGDGLGVGSCIAARVSVISAVSASVHSLSGPSTDSMVGVATRTFSGMQSVQSSPWISSKPSSDLSLGVSSGDGKILCPGTSVQNGSDKVQSADAPGALESALERMGAE